VGRDTSDEIANALLDRRLRLKPYRASSRWTSAKVSITSPAASATYLLSRHAQRLLQDRYHIGKLFARFVAEV